MGSYAMLLDFSTGRTISLALDVFESDVASLSIFSGVPGHEHAVSASRTLLCIFALNPQPPDRSAVRFRSSFLHRKGPILRFRNPISLMGCISDTGPIWFWDMRSTLD